MGVRQNPDSVQTEGGHSELLMRSANSFPVVDMAAAIPNRQNAQICSLDICITTYIEYYYTFRSARVHRRGFKPNQSLLYTADVMRKSQIGKM